MYLKLYFMENIYGINIDMSLSVEDVGIAGVNVLFGFYKQKYG